MGIGLRFFKLLPLLDEHVGAFCLRMHSWAELFSLDSRQERTQSYLPRCT
jgi:hypothetical protein